MRERYDVVCVYPKGGRLLFLEKTNNIGEAMVMLPILFSKGKNKKPLSKPLSGKIIETLQ